MEVVKALEATGWNMSISMMFGKSPKFDIKCGKCVRWFSKRFDLDDLPNPIAKCPYCRQYNEVPLKHQ